MPYTGTSAPLTGSCEPHLCPSFYQTDVLSPTLRTVPNVLP